MHVQYVLPMRRTVSVPNGSLTESSLAVLGTECTEGYTAL